MASSPTATQLTRPRWSSPDGVLEDPIAYPGRPRKGAKAGPTARAMTREQEEARTALTHAVGYLSLQMSRIDDRTSARYTARLEAVRILKGARLQLEQSCSARETWLQRLLGVRTKPAVS